MKLALNAGVSYELVWQNEFENVGPVQVIINGEPACVPNPNSWTHAVSSNIDGGIQNYTKWVTDGST